MLEEISVGGGRTVDLVAVEGSKKIAIEIETGKSDAVRNIRKCLAAGFQKVLVVTASNHVTKTIQNTINKKKITNQDILILTGHQLQA